MNDRCKGITLRGDSCMAKAYLDGYCTKCFQRYGDMKQKKKQLDKLIEWEKK